MKKTKKVISLVMAMMMICLMVVGCGKDEKEAKYEKGTLTENSFKSDYLGLEFSTPEGFTMMSQDQMNQAMQTACEVVFEDDDDKMIDYAKTNVVYEMMCAEATTSYPNVSVVVENVEGKNISEKQYLDIAKKQIEASGLDYKFDDVKEDTEFVGNKYSLMVCHLNMNGVELSQEVYVRKIGDRIGTITLSYLESDKEGKDKLTDAFKEVK